MSFESPKFVFDGMELLVPAQDPTIPTRPAKFDVLQTPRWDKGSVICAAGTSARVQNQRTGVTTWFDLSELRSDG